MQLAAISTLLPVVVLAIKPVILAVTPMVLLVLQSLAPVGSKVKLPKVHFHQTDDSK